jgi:hypothetical protein
MKYNSENRTVRCRNPTTSRLDASAFRTESTFGRCRPYAGVIDCLECTSISDTYGTSAQEPISEIYPENPVTYPVIQSKNKACETDPSAYKSRGEQSRNGIVHQRGITEGERNMHM